MDNLQDRSAFLPAEPCFDYRPPALVIADRATTLDRLLGACGSVFSQVAHVQSADHDRIHAAFTALEADSPILIVTRDRLLVMNKGSDESGCPVCLRLGRMSHGTEHETAAFRKGVICDSAPPEMLTDMALAVAARLIAIVGPDRIYADPAAPAMPRKAFSIDLALGEINAFTTIPDSSCVFCRPAPCESVPFRITAVEKESRRSLRGSGLSDLAVPVDTLVNPICGPLGRIIFHARNGAYCTSARGEFREASIKRSVPIGWFGLVPRPGDCVIAGLLEGLERRAGLANAGPTVVAAYDQLGPEAVDPRTLGVYEDGAYAGDPQLTPFATDREIEWVEGWSIEHRSRRLLPREYCFYGKPGIINGNSSGCATGSTPEEALLHGLLEVIERDAFVGHWLARLSPPKIAPSSVTDIASRAMIARIEEAGGELYLLDARLDLEIPVVISVIINRTSDYGGFSLASGASLLPEEAIRKALFEVAVHFESFSKRAEALSQGPLANALSDYSLVKQLDDHPTMYGLPGAIPLAEFLVNSNVERSFAATYADWESAGAVGDTLDQDLLTLLGILRDAGYSETIAVEQTTRVQRRLGLSTMRAVVPGLLPIDFGFGKCRATQLPRLRELPQRLGLRQTPLEASEFYRVPHPYP